MAFDELERSLELIDQDNQMQVLGGNGVLGSLPVSTKEKDIMTVGDQSFYLDSDGNWNQSLSLSSSVSSNIENNYYTQNNLVAMSSSNSGYGYSGSMTSGYNQIEEVVVTRSGYSSGSSGYYMSGYSGYYSSGYYGSGYSGYYGSGYHWVNGFEFTSQGSGYNVIDTSIFNNVPSADGSNPSGYMFAYMQQGVPLSYLELTMRKFTDMKWRGRDGKEALEGLFNRSLSLYLGGEANRLYDSDPETGMCAITMGFSLYFLGEEHRINPDGTGNIHTSYTYDGKAISYFVNAKLNMEYFA